MDERVFEAILVLVGVIAGWVLSSTGLRTTKKALIETHKETTEAHDKRKKAKIALAEAKKSQASKAAKKKKAEIKSMGLARLAKEIREVFRKAND